MNTKDILRRTLINLEKNSIPPTPNAYSKEYFRLANQVNLELDEYKRFKVILTLLSTNEQLEVKEKNLSTLDDIFPFLLARMKSNDFTKLCQLIKRSIKPSITLDFDEGLQKFVNKLENNPELISEEKIQNEIEELIDDRMTLDREALEKKTKEVSKLINYITKFLGNVITQSASGSACISEIAHEIKDINASNEEELLSLQEKLIEAAESIEKHMNHAHKTLEKGQDSAQILQKRVQELENELAQVKKENETDHLTGLLTRRWYDRQSKRFDDNFIRNNIDYAIVFFDIDHFKKVNDTYGHEAGDVILSTFAKILLKSTRDTDVLGRYGGEEFVGLIHFSEEDELIQYIQRIKAIVTGNKFKYNELKIPITFSAGVALRTQHSSHEDALKHADDLLYKAKKTGRNKIIFEKGQEV